MSQLSQPLKPVESSHFSARACEVPASIRLVLPVMSANRYWRPVRIGNHITIVPTKEAKQYKATVAALAMKAGVRNVLLGRLAMTIRLHPHRPLDWAKRARLDPDNWADSVRCIDLGNCEKVLSDALNMIAWTDDSQLHSITLVRCDPDDHGERVEVEITPIVRPAIAPDMFEAGVSTVYKSSEVVA